MTMYCRDDRKCVVASMATTSPIGASDLFLAAAWNVDEVSRDASRSPGVSLSACRPNQGVEGVRRSCNFAKRPGDKGFGDEWNNIPIRDGTIFAQTPKV